MAVLTRIPDMHLCLCFAKRAERCKHRCELSFSANFVNAYLLLPLPLPLLLTQRLTARSSNDGGAGP